MTASILPGRSSAARAVARPSGLSVLVRKDTTEWLRGRRAWVVLVISIAFMTLAAANAWIVKTVSAQMDVDAPPTSQVPLDNLLQAVGAQVFILAAIFAVASLLVHERESGTLAWVASKPVSRSAIWISKWVSSTIVLALTAVLVPLAITVVVVSALYGAPPLGAVALIAIGAVASVAFFAAVGLAASTVVPGQPAVAAIGFGAFVLVPLIGGIVSAVVPFLPTSILPWSIGAAVGQDVGFVTPIAWAVVTGALAAASIVRMRRIEL